MRPVRGVATEPRATAVPGGEVRLQGTSRSSISRRFRRATEARLAEPFGRDRSELSLPAIFIDGMRVGEHLIVVALGVDSAGRKHPLGLWEGTTENAAVCRALVGNLIDRGLPADRATLFVHDGGKAIRKVIRETWGELALHQRCRNHKLENITGHLPQRERVFVARKVRADAYRTRFPRTLPAEARAALRAGRVDAVTFTSASTVRGFVRLLGAARGNPKVVCIGPVTARAAREAGFTVHAVARPHTLEGLVAAVERALRPRRARKR